MAPISGHAAMAPGVAVADLERRLAALEKAIQVAVDGSITIISPLRITVKAGYSVEIEGSGYIAAKGGVIKLNGGAMPVARVGDQVVNGVVLRGSPTVLA